MSKYLFRPKGLLRKNALYSKLLLRKNVLNSHSDNYIAIEIVSTPEGSVFFVTPPLPRSDAITPKRSQGGLRNDANHPRSSRASLSINCLTSLWC